jgi:hypothetical protein
MAFWPACVEQWGSTAAERAEPFPCDRFLPGADRALFRAIDARAPASVSFRWFCQLREAPYSYDALDNFGRRSPQQLTPGLDLLEVGQRVMTIFRLVAFEPGRSLTIISRSRFLGHYACTYRATPVGADESRIVVKVLARDAGGVLGPLLGRALPPGDLAMMRRQLLNLKRLAERSHATRAPSEAPSR